MRKTIHPVLSILCSCMVLILAAWFIVLHSGMPFSTAAAKLPQFTAGLSGLPTQVRPGQQIVPNIAVTNMVDRPVAALVTVEVLDPGGARHFRRTWSKRSFPPQRAVRLAPEVHLKPNAVAGAYTVRVTVHSPNRALTYYSGRIGGLHVGTAGAALPRTKPPVAPPTATRTPAPATVAEPPGTAVPPVVAPPPPVTPSPTPSILSTQPAPTATPAPTASTIVSHYLTFYGWPDNDPPGPAIAYPRSRYPATVHNEAGGIGTYDDPVTMATAPAAWPIGTRMYIPYLQKYVIMEDYCAGCVDNWQRSGRYHIDVWMNSTAAREAELIQCQYAWTRDDVRVEINPPRGRTVNTAPLFDPSTGVCQTPNP